MPLIQPVPLLPATELGPVHFIAIGGAGMSPIAAMYADLGVRVSGSDQADSAVLDDLRARGIEVHVGHHPDQVGQAGTVVVSTAIRPDNVELVEARRRGLRIWHRSAALGSLMLGSRGIAVTGTHGKTTTSAMTAVLLTESGADPSYVIGSPLTSSGVSSQAGHGEAFVIEADESDGSFLQYPSRIVAVTNIEADHLDNWGTAQAYAAGFQRLATQPGVETVILGADDPGTLALVDPVRASGKQVLTVGESVDADVRLDQLAFSGSGAYARLHAWDDDGELALTVPGRYNLLNAAMAYTVGRVLGLDGEALRTAAGHFDGTHRRFQRVADVAGVTIIDDDAHHPTEVAATLTAARVYAGQHRVVACFQPHLFTRTRDFAGEFATALAAADVVVVLGIYPAREDPIPGVTGRLVAEAAGLAGREVHYVEAMPQAAAALAGLVTAGDLVVTLGAGDVTKVGPRLAELLAEGRAS
ncbi:MAG: UDP-N-acetylmuramate--L-alanine ligase [Propionicimonas sp.]|nr:UDP-N-acetylmuramate--L-alanine ligase [Propionicimonas sp.]